MGVDSKLIEAASGIIIGYLLVELAPGQSLGMIVNTIGPDAFAA